MMQLPNASRLLLMFAPSRMTDPLFCRGGGGRERERDREREREKERERGREKEREIMREIPTNAFDSAEIFLPWTR